MFLRGLRGIGLSSKHGSLVAGHCLQIEDLGAAIAEGFQHAGLGGAGVSIHDSEAEIFHAGFEHLEDMTTVGFVAAVEHGRPPADFGKDRGEAAGALPSSPAVDERPVVPRFVREMGVEVGGNVARNQSCPELSGFEVALLVTNAHGGALFVRKDGQVDRSSEVILRILGWRTHVDDFIECPSDGEGKSQDLDLGAHDVTLWGSRRPFRLVRAGFWWVLRKSLGARAVTVEKEGKMVKWWRGLCHDWLAPLDFRL